MNTVESLLEMYAPSDGPGLACMVIRNGKSLLREVRGHESLDNKTPIATNTVFRLASVSKQFVAAGILMLVQDGELTLEDTLPEFFPDFPEYGHHITIKHLLTHSSGLRDYEQLLPSGYSGYVSDEGVLTLMQGQVDGYFVPGSEYHYSNGAYCLLHLIIERVTDESLTLFLTERIFVPLGMNDAFVHTAGVPDTANMAIGHSRIGDSYQIHNQDATSWTIGDGGIYASIDDLIAWSSVFSAPHRIGDYDLNEMFVPHIVTDEPGRSYGYGLVIEGTEKGRVISHIGETVGSRICIYSIPEEGLVAAVEFNRDDVDPYAFCEKLLTSTVPTLPQTAS